MAKSGLHTIELVGELGLPDFVGNILAGARFVSTEFNPSENPDNTVLQTQEKISPHPTMTYRVPYQAVLDYVRTKDEEAYLWLVKNTPTKEDFVFLNKQVQKVD